MYQIQQNRNYFVLNSSYKKCSQWDLWISVIWVNPPFKIYSLCTSTALISEIKDEEGVAMQIILSHSNGFVQQYKHKVETSLMKWIFLWPPGTPLFEVQPWTAPASHIRNMEWSTPPTSGRGQNYSSCQKVEFNVFCTCNAFCNCNFFASYCLNTALDGDKNRRDENFTFTNNYFDIMWKELQKWLKVPNIYDFKELKPPRALHLE